MAVDRVIRVTTPAVVPVEQYLAGLNRKRTVAGVLFRDAQDRVLLLQPSYKPNCEIPGGAGEADESPWATATREVAEELGITDRPLGALLVVDYVRPQDGRDEGVVFVFDGGLVDATDLVGCRSPTGRSSPPNCATSSGCERWPSRCWPTGSPRRCTP